jgi:hypothetical protein
MDGGDSLQVWRVGVNTINKQWWTAKKGRFSSLGGGWAWGYQRLTIKIILLQNVMKGLGLGQPKLRKMDIWIKLIWLMIGTRGVLL